MFESPYCFKGNASIPELPNGAICCWLADHDRFFQGVFGQAPQSAEAILPAALFSLGVGWARITDANFVDAQPAFGYLDGNLRLETEAVLLKRDGLNDFPAEDFVASFHVGHIHVGQGVRNQGENQVPYRVPDIKHEVPPATEKTRTVYYVSPALNERFQQRGILRRIVFQIRVLNDYEVAGCGLDAAAQGGSFSHIRRLQIHTDLGMTGLQLGKDF